MSSTIIIDNKILADIHLADQSNDWIVIFCHGYKGFKDWGAWNLVAERFAEKGVDFLRFNFSLNGGTLKDPIDFPDLDAFGRNTYSQELCDVNAVIDYGTINYPEKKIGLIGHSRGGGIASLAAAQNKKVSKLVTWAGVCDFKRRFPSGEELKEWQASGVRYVVNGRTKQQMPHYFSFYEDFVANEAKLDILSWVRKLEIPQLIVHGYQDEAVSINEAEELKHANPSSETFYLEANHVFGASHPFVSKTLPIHLLKIVDRTIDFIS